MSSTPNPKPNPSPIPSPSPSPSPNPNPNPNLEEVSFEEFCGAVRLVGSRCLRLSMGWEHGVRRLLNP